MLDLLLLQALLLCLPLLLLLLPLRLALRLLTTDLRMGDPWLQRLSSRLPVYLRLQRRVALVVRGSMRLPNILCRT